jgi:hypothetical protein
MKLNRYCLMMIVMLLPATARAQSLSGLVYRGVAEYIIFGPQNVRVISYDFKKGVYGTDAECTYSLSGVEGIPFIDVSQPISERWLFLHSEQFAIIFRKDNSDFFRSYIGTAMGFDNVRPAKGYEATTALVEGTKVYTATNLGLVRTDNPWVEGVKGPGIGEKLTLALQTWQGPTGGVGGMGALVIVNGFISYNDPSLYIKNNRVRGIRVTAVDNSFTFDCELQDTPNPQIVNLPHPPSVVTIEITSVYPGTKWDDTCLSIIWALEEDQAAALKTSSR